MTGPSLTLANIYIIAQSTLPLFVLDHSFHLKGSYFEVLPKISALVVYFQLTLVIPLTPTSFVHGTLPTWSSLLAADPGVVFPAGLS